MTDDPDRPRPERQDDVRSDAPAAVPPATASAADPTGADHLAESARRAVPTPAAPLDVDTRLVVAGVVVVAILALLLLAWRRRS
jgi:hypothetical protein